MFYLRQAVDFLINRKLLGSLWFILFICFVGTNLLSDRLDQFAQKARGEKLKNPHFYAMIPLSDNISYVQRKVSALPGVERVKLLSSDKVMREVREVLTSMNLDINDKSLGLNYGGIEVVLQHGLQSRSQELIRSYINKIAESTDVLVGTIEKTSITKKSFITELLTNRFSDGINFVLIALYTIFIMASFKPLKEHAFLIETYQRRSDVFIKCFLSLHAPILLIMAMLGMEYVNRASTLTLLVVIIMAVFAIFYRRRQEC